MTVLRKLPLLVALACISLISFGAIAFAADAAGSPNADTVLSLYSSGAYWCAGIVAVYLALAWVSTRFAWLKVPGRAHLLTAGIAGLALLVVPASQGTTPNVSQILIAFSTALGLALPGALASTPSAASKAAKATGALLLMLVAGLTTASCSWFRGSVEPSASAVINCAETQATAATLEDVFTTFIASVASGTEASAVDGLILKYGEKIVACSLAALESPAPAAPITTPAPPRMSDPDPISVAAAAAQELARRGWKTK